MRVTAKPYPLPAPFGMPTKPDSSRQAGEWIARYITRTLRNFPEKQIDYAILSHFHGDHIGKVSPDSKRSPEGRYALTGISEIPEYVPRAPDHRPELAGLQPPLPRSNSTTTANSSLGRLSTAGSWSNNSSRAKTIR
jgi:glyoxylase-like metal-dependent hydrolase (beta-lactamase superfamily II)